jgi:hypothetical protein
MKGDFSRQTFDANKHFLRVLMQQGRVQLDADWNEQVAILLHYLQSLAADLIGQYGGKGDGFLIEPRLNDLEQPIPYDFTVRSGHYYVNGILCENDALVSYTNQPDYPLPDSEKLEKNKNYLVYLDVWERHITYLEDTKFPSIREIALGGPDTATRAKVVWQVKTEDEMPKPDQDNPGSFIPDSFIPLSSETTCPDVKNAWSVWIKKWQPMNRGQVKAKGKEPGKKDNDPCIISPEARYRGAENQLYRVEIHLTGPAWDGEEYTKSTAATFKWSRDNGSVIFPISKLEGSVATLGHLGQDDRRGLKVGQWVEVMDDELALRSEAGPFLQIEAIDLVEKIVTLSNPEDVQLPAYTINDPRHPLLRRWDGDEGLTLIKEADTDQDWIDLEDGIRIQFQLAQVSSSHKYRAGDYWLIAGRSTTGDILWPTEKGTAGKLLPLALPPHGIAHHYAPLAIISVNATGQVTVASDCRCIIKEATVCPTDTESLKAAPQAKEKVKSEIVAEDKPKAGSKSRARPAKRA